MIESIEEFVHSNQSALRWITASILVVISLGAFRFAFADRTRAFRSWFLIGLFSILFAAETVWPVRLLLTGLLREMMRSLFGEEGIQNRRAIQVIVILCLLITSGLVAALWFMKKRSLSRPIQFALIGIGTALAGFVLEIISLHQLDANFLIYKTFRYTGFGLMAWAICLERNRRQLAYTNL